MSFWVSAAIVVASAAAKMYNDKEVARKQDRQMAKQLQISGQHQQEADAQVRQLVDKTAQSNDKGARAGTLDQFMQQLQASNGNAVRPLNQAGAVSDAYTQAANDAAMGVSNYGAGRAGILSSIDAPALQRQNEAVDVSRFNTRLGQIGRNAQADDFLQQMRLRNIKRNPWIDAASSIGMSYAGGRASGAFSGGGSAMNGTGDLVTNGSGYTVNLPFKT